LDHLAISYNGGKDCLVLLILILASLPTEHSEHQTFTQNGTHDGSALPTTTDHNTSSPDSNYPTSLQAIYVISTNPFPQVQSFVATTALKYHLDLASFSNGMRAALADYLVERPKVRAVFVGTRRTDPHGAKLTHFDPTDHGWPACMRVHPIIDWHYIEIWTVSLNTTQR
jgi:FAD synthetase